jgi:putative AbiEi antitoxin of type IV toxin-antitoxin system/uncharacterized protein DUF559
VRRRSHDILPRSDALGLDERIAALAARQHGVVSLAQLGALGLSPRAASYRVEAGRLHRLHRGVFAVGHPGVGAHGLRLAAVLACGPDAVLSHTTAAAVWGMRPTARALIDVTTTASGGRTAPRGVGLHRTRRLHEDDVARVGVLPLTAVPRTLVDLAGVLSPHRLERALHEAEVLRLLDVHAVHAAAARVPTRRGLATLRALLKSTSPGHTRSELESRFLALCRSAGLVPRLNVRLFGHEVDALFPAERVVVELDGQASHHTHRAFHRDRRRDAALAAQGHLTVRLTWDRVTGEPHAVARELARILAAR